AECVGLLGDRQRAVEVLLREQQREVVAWLERARVELGGAPVRRDRALGVARLLVSDAQDEMDLGVVGALFQVELGIAARGLVSAGRSLETGADGERLGVVGIERERAVDRLGPLVGPPDRE